MNVRPAFRNLAIAFTVILIPIVAHQVWTYIELRRLIAEIDAIRARKEPVSDGGGGWAQPGLAQAAGRLYMAAAILSATGAHDAGPTVDSLHQWLAGAWPGPPSDATARLDGVLNESGDALRLADRGGTMAFKGYAPGTDYSYRWAELDGLTRLMGARTLRLAMSGDGDAAIDSELSTMALQRAMRDQYWQALSGTRQETAAILSLSTPSPTALERLQRVLEQDERPNEAAEIMLRGRARAIDLVWRRYYGIEPRAPQRYQLQARSIAETLALPWITHQAIAGLRTWAELIEVARSRSPERIDAALRSAAENVARNPWEPYPAPSSVRWVLLWMSRGAYDAFPLAVRPDNLVLNRASRVALAVERHRRAHQGALPSTLADLVPGFLPSVPADPAAEGSLLFRKEAGSYTIYSVGADRKDDGGDLNSELLHTIKQGYGRRIVRGADIGVRILVH